MAEAARSIKVIWEPQPGLQTLLVNTPANETFAGGTRGSAKTDGVLGEWAKHQDEWEADAQGIILRRKYPDLDGIIFRGKQLYCPHWAKFKAGPPPSFDFYNGAVLKLRYLRRDEDADNYQGHSYTRLYIEEIQQFARPEPVDKMRATLRSAVPGLSCKMMATGNPGGPGHHWVKRRYVDPHPLGGIHIEVDPDTGHEHMVAFIPGRLADNKYLGDEYIANLRRSGPPALVRAWLYGDWGAIIGAYFPEFSNELHIVRPFLIPKHWTRMVSYDWGSASPFSTGWYAVASEMVQTESGRIIPKGAMVKYREWYGANDEHKGIHLPNVDIGSGIKERSGNEKITTKVADPSIFKTEGGPSIAEQIAKGGTTFSPADNNRLAGWKQLRDRLLGQDDKPMLYFFSTCTETIRTLPILQHDPYNAEDADTDAEDHAPDETRYACQSRPYTRPKPPRDKPIVGYQDMTLNQLWAKQRMPKQERI